MNIRWMFYLIFFVFASCCFIWTRFLKNWASCSFDGQCISLICKATGLSSDDAEHLKEKFGENLLEALDLTPATWHGYHALIWDATLYVVWSCTDSVRCRFLHRRSRGTSKIPKLKPENASHGHGTVTFAVRCRLSCQHLCNATRQQQTWASWEVAINVELLTKRGVFPGELCYISIDRNNSCLRLSFSRWDSRDIFRSQSCESSVSTTAMFDNLTCRSLLHLFMLRMTLWITPWCSCCAGLNFLVPCLQLRLS